MLLKVDQLKNDELYFFSEDPVHAYYEILCPSWPAAFFGLLGTQKAFSRAAATLGPLLDLMGRVSAM